METIQIQSKDIQHILNNLNEIFDENISLRSLIKKTKSDKIILFREIIVYVIYTTIKPSNNTIKSLSDILNKPIAVILYYINHIENIKTYYNYSISELKKSFCPNDLIDALIKDFEYYKGIRSL